MCATTSPHLQRCGDFCFASSLTLSQGINKKVKHWRGVWRLFGLKGAPVLVFRAFFTSEPHAALPPNV